MQAGDAAQVGHLPGQVTVQRAQALQETGGEHLRVRPRGLQPQHYQVVGAELAAEIKVIAQMGVIGAQVTLHRGVHVDPAQLGGHEPHQRQAKDHHHPVPAFHGLAQEEKELLNFGANTSHQVGFLVPSEYPPDPGRRGKHL